MEEVGRSTAKSIADMLLIKQSAKGAKEGYKSVRGKTAAAAPPTPGAATDTPAAPPQPGGPALNQYKPADQLKQFRIDPEKKGISEYKPEPMSIKPAAPPPAPRRFPPANQKTGKDLSAKAKSAVEAKAVKDSATRRKAAAAVATQIPPLPTGPGAKLDDWFNRSKLEENTAHLEPRTPKSAAESAETLKPIAEYEGLFDEAGKAEAARAAKLKKDTRVSGTEPKSAKPAKSAKESAAVLGQVAAWDEGLEKAGKEAKMMDVVKSERGKTAAPPQPGETSNVGHEAPIALDPKKESWIANKVTEVTNNIGQAGGKITVVGNDASGNPVINKVYNPKSDGSFGDWLRKFKELGDVVHLMVTPESGRFKINSKFSPQA
jgi:hypothetical protein